MLQGVFKMGINGIEMVDKNQIRYIQFDSFRKYEKILTHCFTTRNFGVSTDEYSSLNMGFKTDDKRENVLENFKRVTDALGISIDNIVLSDQVHDTKIKVVDESDRGKGITRESDIRGYDGLMTNARGVALVTFYADCVPVFLFDPKKKAIALVHSGWRGTVGKIADNAVKMMNEVYGCDCSDILAAIGPSIGKCCFETGDEVYREFSDKMDWSGKYCEKKPDGKWNIGLQGIIKETLVRAGVPEGNITVSNICTMCNRDLFFSHRGDKGRTGRMAAIMQLL